MPGVVIADVGAVLNAYEDSLVSGGPKEGACSELEPELRDMQDMEPLPLPL